jgi:serine/threonine protein kinase
MLKSRHGDEIVSGEFAATARERPGVKPATGAHLATGALRSPIELERIERYVIYETIARGGMASVHLGVSRGALGFSRIVAVKRLHAEFAAERRFADMLIDEARLAARIRHVNAVQTIDVMESNGEVFIIMEYVRGASLAQLVSAATELGERIPLRYVVSILAGALRGLHAAHEATDWDGVPLEIVHRDFSPNNVLVSIGGIPRVIDFGIAKALRRGDATNEGEFMGTVAYASPEQLRSKPVTRQADIFAAGVMLWELLTGERLFRGASQTETAQNVLHAKIRQPLDVLREKNGSTDLDSAAIERIEAIAMRALERDPARRYPSAAEMASALEATALSAPAAELGSWVEERAHHHLGLENSAISRIEQAIGEDSARSLKYGRRWALLKRCGGYVVRAWKRAMQSIEAGSRRLAGRA